MTPVHLLYFLVIGAGGAALATLCYTQAFTLINPSVVILLQKLQPLVAVTLAHFWLKEPLSPQFLAWGCLCLVSVVLIGYQDLVPAWQHWREGALQGYLFSLVAVVGWGAATVFGKKLTLLGYDAKAIMGGRYLTAILALTPLMLTGGGGQSFALSYAQFSQVALIALLSGLLGTYFYYRGLSMVSARVCTLGELFYPLGAVLLNWIFLGFTVHPLQLLGGLGLILGATMVQIKRY